MRRRRSPRPPRHRAAGPATYEKPASLPLLLLLWFSCAGSAPRSCPAVRPRTSRSDAGSRCENSRIPRPPSRDHRAISCASRSRSTTSSSRAQPRGGEDTPVAATHSARAPNEQDRPEALRLLARVQEPLRVERLLDLRVQAVRAGAPLALEL